MSERPILQICSWCLPQRIRVLNLPEEFKDGRAIRFQMDGNGAPASAYTIEQGKVYEFQLSHGICPECDKKFRHTAKMPARVM
jgi:hypothetical protein